MAVAPAITDIPKEPAVRRVWIIGQLRLGGTSLRELARAQGVSHQAMSNALMMPSSHLEEVIARALGFTARQVFPERYNRRGQRLHRTLSPQRSTTAEGDNVKASEAA